MQNMEQKTSEIRELTDAELEVDQRRQHLRRHWALDRSPLAGGPGDLRRATDRPN